MSHPALRWIGDAAAGGAVAAAVFAIGTVAARIHAAERVVLAAEADERCGGDAFRVVCSGVGRIAAERGLADWVADVDRLLHRAGRGRLRSGREAVGQGLLAAAAGTLVVVPLLWAAAGPVLGLVLSLSGLGLFLLSIRSGLVSVSDVRRRAIEGELPYTLDLLGLCMSARASESDALEVAARGEPRTAMTDVMERVRWECERGVPIAESVAVVGEELRIEALVRLGREIDRSRSRGTDLPETLKTLADSERRRRFDAAEAFASEVSTRMLGPSGLVFLSALIVMMGPVVMSFVAGNSGP